jgi:hypothetical protein
MKWGKGFLSPILVIKYIRNGLICRCYVKQSNQCQFEANKKPMRKRMPVYFLCMLLLQLFILSCKPKKNPQAVTDSKPQQKAVVIKPASLLAENTLFTVYGHSFGRAPILGHLGTYKNFEDMEEDIKPWIQGIQERNDKKGVIPGIHLIYAMATTACTPKNNCLLYLDGVVKDLAAEYIIPAEKRGWMVVLDTQIGKSNPVEQVKRMIDKGYLKYENVVVGIDPEFHVYEGRKRPGVPVGKVPAEQINKVQKMLDDYVREQKLTKKKIVIVHQFGDPNVNDGVPFMIEEKKELKTFNNVDLVINMDGFGGKAIKAVKYNKITDSTVYPFIAFRGIKVFFPNRWEKHGHYDKPPMDMDEIFGIKPVEGGATMKVKPNVVIIA